jgi:Rieske Fe-S protein
MSRRRVLARLASGLAIGIGLCVAAPAALFVTFPTRRRTVSGGDEPVAVGALERLPEAVPVRVTVTAPAQRDAWSVAKDVPLGAVWLVRRGAEVIALSSVCPHTGCSVDWEADRRRFVCPCHASAFDVEGRRQAGPAPRAMDQLECQIIEGRVLVRYRRFRAGVTTNAPV